jgi:hypothetical protein
MAAVDRVHVDEKTGEVRYRLPSLTTKLEALGKVGVELGMFINRSDNRRAVADDLMERAREVLERQRTIEAQAQVVEPSVGWRRLESKATVTHHVQAASAVLRVTAGVSSKKPYKAFRSAPRSLRLTEPS